MTAPLALVVDDEPNLVEQLRRLLLGLWPQLRVVTATDGPSALALAQAERPDFAFLDIRMPGMSGLEVGRRLSGRAHVVFVTAYDEYALQAFDSAAVDYLLKPVDEARLARTIDRLRARLSASPPDLSALLEELGARLRPRASFLQWLQVQRRQDLVLVPVDEVAVFQASEKYTLAVTPEDEHVIRTPLKDLEAQLDPERFWRVHRNAIVRVAAIAHASRDLGGRLSLHLRGLDRTVAVSRAYAGRFHEM